MRENSDRERIYRLMTETGKLVSVPVTVYFNGGATAVLFEIRETTIDVDIKFLPDEMQMYLAIQVLKEKLNMNIELASPDHFIPALPRWQERSIFIEKHGRVTFYHYDLYSQIISKVQRGWRQDLADASGFRQKIKDEKLLELFKAIKQDFIKYPAVDPNQLEEKLNRFLTQ